MRNWRGSRGSIWQFGGVPVTDGLRGLHPKLPPDFAIFIGCYRGDFFLAKILCASIRYFCGDVPIVLIKDGAFDTSQILVLGNIAEFDREWVPAPLRSLRGFGVTKLMTFFQTRHPRYLYLDADICLVNNVLQLPFQKTQFYVDTTYLTEVGLQADAPPLNWTEAIGNPDWVRQYIFDPALISSFDPTFQFNELILFNTGQFFGTTGQIDLDLLLACLDFSAGQTEAFALKDQGILNYLLNKGKQEKRFTLSGEDFKIGGGYETPADYLDLTLETLRAGTFDKRWLIHWAGVSALELERYNFSFVLEEFQRQYYRRLSLFAFWQDWTALRLFGWTRTLRRTARGILKR